MNRLAMLLALAMVAAPAAMSEEAPKPPADPAPAEPAPDKERGASAGVADFEEITPELERAVESGLKYLRKQQQKDGHWESNGQYPMAMTGLAGLAFLSAGKVPGRGEDGKILMQAVQYILKHQKSDGLFDSGQEGGRPMYGHGFATTFLSQVYGMEVGGDDLREKIRRALENSVKLTAKAQSPEGGWYYTPENNQHEGSVTVTQSQGIRAASNVGIDVPTKTIQKLVTYMKGSQNTDGSINYQFGRGQSGGRPALTAAGVEVFLSAGEYNQPHTQKAMANLRQVMNSGISDRNWGHDTYFTYYASQAVFQFGGEDWKKYFPIIRKRLLSSQNQSTGGWEGDGMGQVYGTAIYLQVLCLPYRYLPIFQR
jgi:hypothetical protein